MDHRHRPRRSEREKNIGARARRRFLRAHRRSAIRSSTPTSRSRPNAPSPRPIASTPPSPEAKRSRPLAGVPIAVKDVISTRGVRTTCGSKILENYVPPYDATAIERLEQAGAVILGKTNCDEFAMGSSNENSAYGPVRNPVALDRVPGGSSGGSAAAVAAGLAVAALGTDTGGSIRQPGACCGIPGLMPTYGRVSRYGLIAFASSLDRIGPFATQCHRRRRVMSVIAGHDPNDSTSAAVPVPDYLQDIETPLQGLRIGVPEDYFGEGLDPEVKEKVLAGIALLENARLRRVSAANAPHRLRHRHLLHCRHGRSQLESRPLRWCALWAARLGRRH